MRCPPPFLSTNLSTYPHPHPHSVHCFSCFYVDLSFPVSFDLFYPIIELYLFSGIFVFNQVSSCNLIFTLLSSSLYPSDYHLHHFLHLHLNPLTICVFPQSDLSFSFSASSVLPSFIPLYSFFVFYFSFLYFCTSSQFSTSPSFKSTFASISSLALFFFSFSYPFPLCCSFSILSFFIR